MYINRDAVSEALISAGALEVKEGRFSQWFPVRSPSLRVSLFALFTAAWAGTKDGFAVRPHESNFGIIQTKMETR